MSKLNNKKGFTLIELLVVIAIIGILSSIVLASLNTARAKGSDAAIKSSLDQMRSQSEIYYDANNQQYATVATTSPSLANCTLASSFVASGQQGATILAYASSTSGAAANIKCVVGKTGWSVSVPLKSNSTLSWCVDNTGASKQETASTSQAADGTCL